MAILEQQKQSRDGSDHVFTCCGRKEKLSPTSMSTILRNMGIKAKVTVHGFRSTFRDWAGNETEFQRETIEECLAHRVGNSVENAYRRSTALRKMRELLEAWTEYCDGSALLKEAA